MCLIDRLFLIKYDLRSCSILTSQLYFLFIHMILCIVWPLSLDVCCILVKQNSQRRLNKREKNAEATHFHNFIIIDRSFVFDCLSQRLWTMDSGMHIRIAITSSMIMTFILCCILKDTRASAFLFQNILIDRTRDQLLYARCWWNNDNGMVTFLH